MNAGTRKAGTRAPKQQFDAARPGAAAKRRSQPRSATTATGAAGAPGSQGSGPVRSGTQRRIERMVYLLLLPLFFLGYKFVILQGLRESTTNAGASGAQTFMRRQELPTRRAEILAADGTAMAVTLDEYTVCANPRAVRDKEKMARLLAESLGGAAPEYLALLRRIEKADGSSNFYVRLARHVDEARVQKLRDRMKPLPGEKRAVRALRRKFWEPLSFEAAPRRNYPLGDFASQLVGFTTNAGAGADGLEWAWNNELSGAPGEVVSQVDARGRPVPGFVQERRDARAGRSVRTTIDPEIQADTDTAMRELVRRFKPNFASAIVLRPRTGEIVAMSNAPSFDLNKRPRDVVQLATNHAVSFAYEPGSTFKIITAAAAVENVPDWKSRSFFCNGVQRVGRHDMHCWVHSTSQQRHGDEDLSESIRDSCNFGVYGFARLAGAPTMLDYARRFGLGERIEIAGLRSAPGLLSGKPEGWSAEQLANFSFGQGMLMTPLQLARVAGAIANDGVMMKPLLVRELRDEEGRVLQEWKPEVERRVVKPETARIVRAMMERVTREGTAREYAFVPGYRTAGKTGSAQKAEGRKGYARDKFISSFVGFVPAQRPKFVILVVADEPKSSHWGSEVCGPAFAAIAKNAMLHLRLREGTAAPAPAPELMKLPAKVGSRQ